MNRISVIMSVYKSERPEFLDRALKSVWTDQTLRPYQIVVIEDGPLPGELDEVISRWKEIVGDGLVIHQNRENLGLTRSLNIAVSLASGDLLARMDSDDISLPERFSRQAKFLNENPDIDILGGSIEEIDEAGNVTNRRVYPLSPESARKYIVKASPLAHPTVMMRKKIFDGGLAYNEKYRTSQDIALWFDALAADLHISNLEDTTLYFRLTSDTIRRRNRSKAYNEFKIYMKGIRKLYGHSFYYIYPISRLVFRLLPSWVIRKIYGSKWRKAILKNS